MIWQQDRNFLSKKAAEALTAHYFVKEGTTEGDVDLCDTLGEAALGVCPDGAASGDDNVRVTYSGVELVVASAAISRGAKVTAAASGKAVTATTGHTVNGIALSGADADGDLIAVLLVPPVFVVPA